MIKAALLCIALVAALIVQSPPSTAREGCLFFCPDPSPEEAREILSADLAAPLPTSVEVLNFVEGGFQDRFIQAKLRGTPEDAAAILNGLGHEMSDLSPLNHGLGAAARDGWWDIGPDDAVPQLQTEGPDLPYINIGIRPDPDRPDMVLIYIFGFQT